MTPPGGAGPRGGPGPTRRKAKGKACRVLENYSPNQTSSESESSSPSQKGPSEYLTAKGAKERMKDWPAGNLKINLVWDKINGPGGDGDPKVAKNPIRNSQKSKSRSRSRNVLKTKNSDGHLLEKNAGDGPKETELVSCGNLIENFMKKRDFD
jgi:hypothetical protein